MAWAALLLLAAAPNVVIVMTDDQGHGDLGCHGNKVIRTPNLDKLHSQSVRLTDFHVDATCSPTRASLMTGRYSSRTGVWRLTVLHERRAVARVRVRATRAERGFEHRVVVRDWAGADAVSARAVSPAGETCTATATVAGS